MIISFTERVIRANALCMTPCSSAIVWLLLTSAIGVAREEVSTAQVAPPTVVVVCYMRGLQSEDEVLSLDVHVCLVMLDGSTTDHIFSPSMICFIFYWPNQVV